MVDTRSGRQHDIALPEGWNTLSEAGILGWDGDRLYAVIAHFGTPRRLRLVEIDGNSGALRTVLEEASDTRLQLNVYSYNRPAVAILPGQDTAVWFSQRDGWGHLYRVRLSDGKCCASSPAATGRCATCWVWTLPVAGRTSAPAASTVATPTYAACTVYRCRVDRSSAWPPMATTIWPMPAAARCSAGAPPRRCRLAVAIWWIPFPSRPATTHRAAGQR